MPRKQNCIACLYAERVLAHSERLQTSDATPDFGPSLVYIRENLDSFQSRGDTHSYNLHGLNNRDLPYCRLSNTRDCFPVLALRMFNKLPQAYKVHSRYAKLRSQAVTTKIRICNLLLRRDNLFQQPKFTKKENLRFACNNQARVNHLRRREVTCDVSDVVLKRNHLLSSDVNAFVAKLTPKYIGPFKIDPKAGYNTYRTINETTGKVSKGQKRSFYNVTYVAEVIETAEDDLIDDTEDGNSARMAQGNKIVLSKTVFFLFLQTKKGKDEHISCAPRNVYSRSTRQAYGGVPLPQGGVLSPLLFSVYVADIHTNLEPNV
ncbi:hypothetical protein J6590_095464 [Homalodisca vitripennis]|nr:hypothetical protein J6590_095464 [Homalodisca vitripennis]